MNTGRRLCARCENLRRERWMVGDVCYFCREARANMDERPVSVLLSGMFRQPKPAPKKTVVRTVETGVHSEA